MSKKIKLITSAAIVFTAAISFAESCHVVSYADKVTFRDAVDALQCQYRKNGQQITLLPVGKNIPVMKLETFEKYRQLPIYDFAMSASTESPYEFSVEKMNEGGNDDFTIFAISYKKIKTAKPIEQMSPETRAAYLAMLNKNGDTETKIDRNNGNSIQNSKTLNLQSTVLNTNYTIDNLIDELATIRTKIKDINESGFDKEFIDWDLNRMIQGIEQFKATKKLSEG